MLVEAIRLAIRAISRNALRSFLTMLGIVIGVGALIALVTIGNGTTAEVAADLASLGSNRLFVRPGQMAPTAVAPEARPFTAHDIEALRPELAGAQAVAPVARRRGTVVAGADNRHVPVTGPTTTTSSPRIAARRRAASASTARCAPAGQSASSA